MFTGIVEELGSVVALEQGSASARLVVRSAVCGLDAGLGDSIAVNGVCLTVTCVTPAQAGVDLSFDVMAESLERSSLAAVRPGVAVNLERAVTMQTRLGGHLVQGHVDGTAEVLTREAGDAWEIVRIALPADLSRYVVEKGSITVDGTSLTVSRLGPDWFEVSLIPTTLVGTTLGTRVPGGLVNLEVDVIAKHVERLLAARTEETS